ncbi:MAG TPA: hypothetical protein VMT43_07455 [Acidimicrobiales bacterium]|nr:hypothetical protein [Acidimicrobiales bacterium]
MRCPLADSHDYVEAESDEFGPHLVCVDCDHVALLASDETELEAA